MSETLTFYVLASLTIISSVVVVTARRPIVSLVALTCALCLLAGIYASLGAYFIAAIQALIYPGAAFLFFLLVIKRLNLYNSTQLPSKNSFGQIILGSFTFLSLTLVGMKLLSTSDLEKTLHSQEYSYTYEGTTQLFYQYLWPLKLIPILILLTVLATLLITRKNGQKL